MKLYDVCGQCGRIIHINKFILGGFHLCVDPEKDGTAETSQYLRDRYFHNQDLLNKLLSTPTGGKGSK